MSPYSRTVPRAATKFVLVAAVLLVALLGATPPAAGQAPPGQAPPEQTSPGPAGATAEAEAPGVLTKLGSMLTFYGFLRIDTIYDTEAMNDTQVPIFVRSDDDPAAGSNDFSIYSRLTRIGFDLDGGTISNGADLTGRFEVDFYGFDSSESRSELRIRHAYLKLERDDLTLLAGQTHDLYSPLYPSVNPDMLNWHAGNTGDRRPQLRLGYSPSVGDGTLGIFGAIALQGAVDQIEIDGGGDGVLDGEDSGVPQIQGRVSYSTELLTEAESEFGVWFAYGREETDGPPVGTSAEDEWSSSIFGVDVKLPITEELRLLAEVWTGENATDFRGGINQGINAVTGDEIAAIGYWVQLDYSFSDTTNLFVGYSVDDPDDGDLPTGTFARDKNELLFAGAGYKVWNPVRFGWDYTFWTTEFVDQADGENHRFRFWISYYF